MCNSIELMVSACTNTQSHSHGLCSPTSRGVYECLKKHGHDVTNRVMYGDDAPLFQVTVQSLFSLKKLIAKLPQVDKELETVLKGKSPILLSFIAEYHLNS